MTTPRVSQSPARPPQSPKKTTSQSPRTSPKKASPKKVSKSPAKASPKKATRSASPAKAASVPDVLGTDFDPSVSVKDKNFDFSIGEGFELKTLHTWPKRTTASSSMEATMAPLHRLVYGRPGQAGQRCSALADFKGFGTAVPKNLKERLIGFKKQALVELCNAFSMKGAITSQKVEALADRLYDFLVKPSMDEVHVPAAVKKAASKPAKAAPAEPKRAAKRAREDDDDGETEDKSSAEKKKVAAKARAEAKPSKKAEKDDEEEDGVHDDTIRISAVRYVWSLNAEERKAFTVGGLLKGIESILCLEAGAAKPKKVIALETALECLKKQKAAVEEAQQQAAAEPVQERVHSASPVRSPKHVDGAPADEEVGPAVAEETLGTG